MSMTKEESKFVEHAFVQYCSMHELAKANAQFPKHLISDMEKFLSEQITFSVDKLANVFSTQNSDYAQYQLDFAEKVLHAKDHLADIAHYYGDDIGHYKNHCHWFFQKILEKTPKERKIIYETNLIHTLRDYAVESYKKRNPNLDEKNLGSFCGTTIYQDKVEQLGLKLNFMTYFLIYAKENMASSYDNEKQELGKKLFNQIVQDYQKINHLTFDEFKEQYALSCLTITRHLMGVKFRAISQFFNIDFKEEAQYKPVYLSHLQHAPQRLRATDEELINTFLTHNFNYDDKSSENVSVRVMLWNRLYSFMTNSINVSNNSEFKAELLNQKIEGIFNQLDKWQKEGLDLTYLFQLKIGKKDGTSTLTLPECFEQHVTHLIDKNKNYSSVEIEKLLFEATSRCRTLINPISEGKKIKL